MSSKTVYRHVFIEEHDLMDGHHRFVPDYDMAQSWQRLRSGKGVQKHDLTLLLHEYEESKLMATGNPIHRGSRYGVRNGV